MTDCKRPCAVSETLGGYAIATNGLEVFVSDFDTGRLLAIPVEGGSATTVTTTSSDVYGLVATQDELIWTARPSGELAITSRQGETLAAWSAPGAVGLVRMGSFLFWASDASDGGIERLDRASGDRHVFVAGAGARMIDASADRVVFTAYESNEVGWVSLDGENRGTLDPASQGPWGLHVAERQGVASVFWANSVGGDVLSVSLYGGSITVWAEGLDGPHDVIFANDTVYVTEERAGRVLALREGEPPRVLAEGQTNPKYMVIAGPYLFWTNRSGPVMKVRL